MNDKLHHEWVKGRDGTRKSAEEGPQVREEDVAQNKVLIKQSKPR